MAPYKTLNNRLLEEILNDQVIREKCLIYNATEFLEKACDELRSLLHNGCLDKFNMSKFIRKIPSQRCLVLEGMFWIGKGNKVSSQIFLAEVGIEMVLNQSRRMICIHEGELEEINVFVDTLRKKELLQLLEIRR